MRAFCFYLWGQSNIGRECDHVSRASSGVYNSKDRAARETRGVQGRWGRGSRCHGRGVFGFYSGRMATVFYLVLEIVWCRLGPLGQLGKRDPLGQLVELGKLGLGELVELGKRETHVGLGGPGGTALVGKIGTALLAGQDCRELGGELL